MEKYIRLINIDSLSREDIFQTFHKLDECKFYDISSNGISYLSNEFWEIIKNYCNTGTLDIIKEIKTEPSSFENFILINVSIKSENDETDDEFAFANIPYLLAFLFQLQKNYTVCMYNNDSIVATNKNYFRLSYFLNLWAAQSQKIKNIKYLEITKDISKSDYNPKGLAYSFQHDTPADTLLPIITLSQEMYQYLEKPYQSKNNISLNELLKKIKKSAPKKKDCYNYYEEYIYQVIGKIVNDSKRPKEWLKKEKRFFKSTPSVITVYIYAMMIRYISNDDLVNIGFETIVEKCFDYSQGLMQLLENSIKHVVNTENDSCAFFSIRMHHQLGAIDDYLQNQYFENLKYFLEISVIDCCKSSCEIGIVSKYNQTLKSKGFDSLNGLADIFESSKALEKYYSDVSNVSNHYGLQIFDTALTSNNGLFIVKSGDTMSPHIYTNSSKVYYDDKRVYVDFDNEKLCNQHFCGTNYTIILPIHKNDKNDIPENLSIGNVPLNIEDAFDSVDTKILEPIKLKSGLKETFIEQYIEKIKSLIPIEILLEDSFSDKKRIISFSIYELSNSRMQLELLCKAVFSFLASNEANISVICLLDVENEFKILDIARIIALFYDKIGNCQFMDQKGIYVASADNEYDILFTGNNIKSVIEGVERQRLMKSLPDYFYNHVFYALNGRISGGVSSE